MEIQFRKISDFKRGTLLKLLKDAYSFDCRYEQTFVSDWIDFDNFFYDNLNIADKYGFFTTFDDIAVGFISWDPRNMPDYAEIGHNCIISKYKGNGFGKMQLQEAVNRIIPNDVRKIIVTTNQNLVAAQKMYESIGFLIHGRRKNQESFDFAGDYIDYLFAKEGGS
jgi:ribosomal protein S18 acetylase RimI-like enzyme